MYPRAYATTVDFQHPSITNIQNVLKESWPLLGLVGAFSTLIAVTDSKILGGNNELRWILGPAFLLAAGYGYMSTRKQ